MIKLKCLCIKCNKDISKNVDKVIENFEVGKIICPHCKMQQKRYLSESDMLMYFGIAATYYCLLISLFMIIYETFGFNIITLSVICILFILSYFVLKQVTRFIYLKAPFKSNIKDFEIDEDKEAVTKRNRWQFIAFMVVALMMSSQPELFNYYVFLLFAFVSIIILKLYLCLKNEYNSINKK